MEMKATGIVRRVDDLGRVVLPIELRRTLHIDIKDDYQNRDVYYDLENKREQSLVAEEIEN